MTDAERIVEGVSLESYAFVTAGIADGLALEDLLEHQGLDPAAWHRADEAWGEVLLDDLEHEMELTFVLDEAQRKARGVWVRPIPPLDSDLRAWLDFLRGLGGVEDVMAHLASIPLSASDLGRLQRDWAARMREDPGLMERASAILSAPAEPVDVPSPGPPRLPPRAIEGTGTGFHGALDHDELPFDAPPKSELRLAPPLSVPLPPPPAEESVDGTAALGVVIGDLTLPFCKAATPEEVVEPPPASPRETTTSAPPLLPSAPPPAIASAPSPAIASAQPPATASPPPAIASPPPAIASPPPATASPPPATASPPPAIASPLPATEQTGPSIDGTTLGAVAPIADVLPFDPDAPGGRPPTPSPEPASDVGGDTSFLDVAQLGLDTLPFQDAPDLDGTALAMAPISEAPLPFRPGTPASPAPPSDDEDEPRPGVGGTRAGVRPQDLMDSATPFEHGPLPSALIPGGLTLEQYAAVEEELALDPSRAQAVLHQYGLDAARRRQHAKAVELLLDRDVRARMRWAKARLTYRAWRRGGAS